MGSTGYPGVNNFQFANNNMNQINNFNGFNNPLLNQYNQINPMLNQMNTYYQDNTMLNQMGNNNQINPMLNQMNTYYQGNSMLYQMGSNNQNNSMLNQMNNYNQGNPMMNQMNNYNQNNQIGNFNQNNQMLNQMGNCNQNNQMNNYNQNNPMLNQMNAYDQNNLMLNQMMNQMVMMMNQMMKQNNKKNQENDKIKEIIREKRIKEINREKRIKRIKEIIQNINLSNLNKNQMELINSIIKFYKENNNEYMNFDYPNQIKNMVFFLSLKYDKLDISDNIEDPLYYIEGPKKMIKFINSNYKEYKVKIPLSITKYDLYSIAQNYKCFKNNNKHYTSDHSNILLINNNLILNRDETSIEFINENDIIIIIEPRNFPDDSYYKSLQERTKNKGNIFFKFSLGKVIIEIFPDDIKIYEIYKSINLEFGLDINTYKLLSNGEQLKKMINGKVLFCWVKISFLMNTFK